MTVPTFLFFTVTIILKGGIMGTHDYSYNRNHSSRTNSLTDRNELQSEIVPLDNRINRIFNLNEKREGDLRKRGKRELLEDRCALFNSLTHPHPKNDSKYYRDIDCVTVINGAEGTILELKFVDLFDIEYHPLCEYDFLEIRDGTRGYGTLLGGNKLCGQQFPGPINTTGPHAWLKFHSDETIENEGFRIKVTEIQSAKSYVVPDSCHIKRSGDTGVLDINSIIQKCKDDSANQALEVLWTIEAAENHMITLNFTKFELTTPNSCKDNVVQVFGSILEFDSKLAHFCGSIAESVTTIVDSSKGEEGNVMNVRFYTSKASKESQKFTAQYTVFRKLDTSDKSDACVKGEEFDCQDGTCISLSLICDEYANCKMKADESPELCKGEIDVFNQDLQVIVIILSLIVSSMTIVFLFKCFKKLYTDQKIIKENLQKSMENGLDALSEIRLALDDKSERDSHQGLFLEKERENLITQNKPKQKQNSMDSIFEPVSRFDSKIVLWRKEVESAEVERIKIELNESNGKTKRKDFSKKEESLRIKRDSKEKKEEESIRVDQNIRSRQTDIIKKDKSLDSTLESEEIDKNEMKDVSVGTTDVKEFGCQTRDSLFLTDAPRYSNASRSKSRSLSIAAGSSEDLSRPSRPSTKTSEFTLELFHQVPHDTAITLTIEATLQTNQKEAIAATRPTLRRFLTC
ncbi:uncharacterized protein LOC128679918 isoform X2 [Plodia interpunctella]|uniref:uncharacterized protein LOC128679918 isoform X2 n=1 Tax=Plodia interpunctella TaxID=58824 RepID=UPI0023674DB7|nr:uncharacterized protein LOC128679918 isoform X2 [Plodia interpunctella]